MPFTKGHTINNGRSGRKCKKKTRDKMKESHLGKKHSKATIDKLKGGNSTSFKKGHAATNWKGRKHTQTAKDKIGEASRRRTPWNKGLKGYQDGNKNPNWKGGITPLTIRIRNCFKYRQWRSDVFTRDDFTCQKCGERGGRLEADHYPKKFSDIFHEYNIKSLEQALACEEFWNINNGRTLCKKCHRLK